MGHLVPPPSLDEDDIARGLCDAMAQRRFLAGHGVPSVPTRYVATLNPADRAWLDPTTEDRLARALADHADRAGYLIVGEIEVELETDAETAPGRPLYWAGFREYDLLVLAHPQAALAIFSDAR